MCLPKYQSGVGGVSIFVVDPKVYEKTLSAIRDALEKYFDVHPREIWGLFDENYDVMKEFFDKCVKYFKGVKIAIEAPSMDWGSMPKLALHVCGETYPIRETLKKMNFSWDPYDRCWRKKYEYSNYEKMVADAENLVKTLRDMFIVVKIRATGDVAYGLVNGSKVRDIIAKKDEEDKKLLDALRSIGFAEGFTKQERIWITIHQTPDPEETIFMVEVGGETYPHREEFKKRGYFFEGRKWKKKIASVDEVVKEIQEIQEFTKAPAEETRISLVPWRKPYIDAIHLKFNVLTQNI
jgi:hypothetical protein